MTVDLPTKREMRKTILAQRDALSKKNREAKSKAILELLTESDLYKEAEQLLSFVSFGSEVDTLGIIRDALQQGKKVYCPRVEGEELIFYRVLESTDLKPGYRGIMEPIEGLGRWSQEEKGLLLLPGTVFDRNKNRIGYGKGFYDRFLEKQGAGLTTMALAFSMQIVEQVPAEAHDCKAQYIVTEDGIF